MKYKDIKCKDIECRNCPLYIVACRKVPQDTKSTLKEILEGIKKELWIKMGRIENINLEREEGV